MSALQQIQSARHRGKRIGRERHLGPPVGDTTFQVATGEPQSNRRRSDLAPKVRFPPIADREVAEINTFDGFD
jgi:hypothetical protein